MKRTPAADPTPPILHVSGWAKPVPMPAPVSSAGAEDSACMSPDGSTLFFFFTPDVRLPPEKQLAQGATGIYYSMKTGSVWSMPRRARLASTPTDALDGAETLHGSTLWFASVRNGNYREIDIYTCTFKDGKFSNVKNAGARLNKEIGVGELDFSPDGTELYFHSSAISGKGGMDIFVTRSANGTWTDPVPVDAVNTAGNDGYPFITQDGRELWFTRTINGTPAVLRSLRNGAAWGAPELVISQFAGEPNLDAAGNIYFTHHYYENGTMIEADIYVAYRN
jgi:Tol biopolymer transport system component